MRMVEPPNSGVPPCARLSLSPPWRLPSPRAATATSNPPTTTLPPQLPRSATPSTAPTLPTAKPTPSGNRPSSTATAPSSGRQNPRPNPTAQPTSSRPGLPAPLAAADTRRRVPSEPPRTIASHCSPPDRRAATPTGFRTTQAVADILDAAGLPTGARPDRVDPQVRNAL